MQTPYESFAEYISDKRIAVMGLGLLGRGVGVVEFLAQQEDIKELIVTDLKDADALEGSMERLKPYVNNIIYHLGGHDAVNFAACDVVIHGADIKQDNKYLTEARENGVELFMDETFLLKFIPQNVTIIGITGTRGKSTTTMLIHHIVRYYLDNHSSDMRTVYLGGNIRGIANIPLVKNIRGNDILVMELSSWQLSDWRRKKISPNIAVFTNFFDDHMNYYHNDREWYWRDKASIFANQKEGDVTIFGPQFEDFDLFSRETLGTEIIVADKKMELSEALYGKHNYENALCAYEACKAFGLSDDAITEGMASFAGVEGRCQLLGEYRGVRVINDNNATAPEATIAALEAFGDLNKLTLIMGGKDKELDMTKLLEKLESTCARIVFLNNTGTQSFLQKLPKYYSKEFSVHETLPECIDQAFSDTKAGNTILFSPAFASFGAEFNNEYERNDLFVEYIKKYE